MASLDYSFFPMGMITYPEDTIWGQYKHYLRDRGNIQYGASLITEAMGNATSQITNSLQDVEHSIKKMDNSLHMINASIQFQTKQLTAAINEVGNKICAGLDNVSKELVGFNRRADMMIEQQRMSNLLLQNIVELLKIPNSEKERQQAITNGIRFLANASINPELYGDALEEFLKAESFQKQDYFVLHRIGCIYLYSEDNLAPDKAMDYFARAAKYAKVESDPNAVRMANLLTNSVNATYSQTISNTNSILHIAANSYEKAAFAAYVVNNLQKAIEYQELSNALQQTPQGLFLLSKYQAHENNMEASLPLLTQAVESEPKLASGIFQEVDMMVQPDIVNYIDQKNKEVNAGLEDIMHYLEGKMNTSELEKAYKEGSFAVRTNTLKRYRRRLKL